MFCCHKGAGFVTLQLADSGHAQKEALEVTEGKITKLYFLSSNKRRIGNREVYCSGIYLPVLLFSVPALDQQIYRSPYSPAQHSERQDSPRDRTCVHWGWGALNRSHVRCQVLPDFTGVLMVQTDCSEQQINHEKQEIPAVYLQEASY